MTKSITATQYDVLRDLPTVHERTFYKGVENTDSAYEHEFLFSGITCIGEAWLRHQDSSKDVFLQYAVPVQHEMTHEEGIVYFTKLMSICLHCNFEQAKEYLSGTMATNALGVILDQVTELNGLPRRNQLTRYAVAFHAGEYDYPQRMTQMIRRLESYVTVNMINAMYK